MPRFPSVLAGVLVLSSLGTPLMAQDEKSLDINVFGVGNAPLQNLNTNPTLGFKSGVGGGVGITYILEKNFGLRADVSFVKSDVDIPSTSCTPQPTCVIGPVGAGLGGSLNSLSWSHINAGADFVLRFPMGDRGPVPYFTTGAGVVHFSESGGRTTSRATGRFGAGIKFPLADKIGVFAQANAQVYNFDQRLFEYFTMVQVDMLLSAGVSIKVF